MTVCSVTWLIMQAVFAKCAKKHAITFIIVQALHMCKKYFIVFIVLLFPHINTMIIFFRQIFELYRVYSCPIQLKYFIYLVWCLLCCSHSFYVFPFCSHHSHVIYPRFYSFSPNRQAKYNLCRYCISSLQISTFEKDFS